MARQPRPQRGDAAIANNIAARRKEFLDGVHAKQREAKRLAKIAQAGKMAIAKAEAKIGQQMKAVRVGEKNLNKTRRMFQKAETSAKNAEAALATAQSALDDFDKRLQELVGTTPPKQAGRKAAGRPKRVAGKASPKAARKKGTSKVTQADALVDVLPGDHGIPVQEILERVKRRFSMDIKKSSAGTTLSLLKRKGKVANLGDGWRTAASSPEPEPEQSDEASAPPPAEDAS
jgi:exonuclease VII small subunit